QMPHIELARIWGFEWALFCVWREKRGDSRRGFSRAREVPTPSFRTAVNTQAYNDQCSVSRLEIVVACKLPFFSYVPSAMMRSLSFTSAAVISFTFLLLCSWLVNLVESS